MASSGWCVHSDDWCVPELLTAVVTMVLKWGYADEDMHHAPGLSGWSVRSTPHAAFTPTMMEDGGRRFAVSLHSWRPMFNCLRMRISWVVWPHTDRWPRFGHATNTSRWSKIWRITIYAYVGLAACLKSVKWKQSRVTANQNLPSQCLFLFICLQTHKQFAVSGW